MEKRKYEKPMLVSEAFLPNEYVAVCVDDGNFELAPGATPFAANTKFYLDTSRDGILQEAEKNSFVTTNNSQKPIGDKNENYYGWVVDSNHQIRYRLFKIGNSDQQWVAYEEKWVTNKNNS